MIGRQALPDRYQEFNARWGAPYGHAAAATAPLQKRLDNPTTEYGPFAYQIASGTRVFEYPWIFYNADLRPGLRVLDVGGCVGGLQFVMAMEGCDVVNVDPFDEGADGWPSGSLRYVVGPDRHDRLNETFGTKVELVRARLQDAELADGSFDRVVCVSVIEHVPQPDAEEMGAKIAALLKPGGLFVTTIDLFLDLKPFGVLDRNCYGTNLDVYRLVKASGLELVEGDPRELYGFPEFDRDRIVAELDELMVAPRYPVLTQSLVLRKHS